MSPEALNTVIDTNFLLQYHHQLVQLKSQLDSFRNHFLRTKAYSSASGSEIIRISADILYLLHEHFAATNEITSSKHQALVFALYEFLHTNLISPLLHSDTKSAKRLEKHLESAWIGCCCEVIIFIALEQILNNVNASTRWSIEFGEPDADRTDAIDILLTIDSKRFHIQVKSRSNSILIPDIEVFDSKQLLKSPTDLERMKIDYETVERLQIGLFQLNAQGIVIVVKQSLLNLETASPTAELITLLEQALQKIGILPQVNLNAV